MTNELSYNEKEIDDTTSILTVEYDNTKVEIFNSKENVNKLAHIISEVAGEINSLASECTILKQSSISATDYAHLQSHLSDIMKIMGMENNVIDYDEKNLKGPMFSFKEFFTRFGYLDPNVKLRPVDYKNIYHEFCNKNGYECEPLGHILPIQHLENLFGAKNMRSVAFPGTSTYVYHIGIKFDDDIIETKLVNNDYDIINIDNYNVNGIPNVHQISNNNIQNFINKDDLNFMYADELFAYCQIENIKCTEYKSNSNWFKINGIKSNDPLGIGMRRYIKGKFEFTKQHSINDILSLVKSKSTQVKIIVDYNGGIKNLYYYAKKGMVITDVVNDMETFIDPKYFGPEISKYLKILGLEGWKNFVKISKECETWEDCKQIIIKKISNIN